MFTFLKNGNVAFFRSDDEQAEWTQEEMNLQCVFPYDPQKVIERGMIVLFPDPATGAYQAYEIRDCTGYAAEGYQQFTAEDTAISDLTDCHIPEKIEMTQISVQQALNQVLTGTGWSVGTVASNIPVSSCDIGRGSVWNAVCTIRTNWNVYILPRVTVNSSGITGRYLDVIQPEGTWRGLRIAVNKNFDDPCVRYDDSELYTAVFAYGATYSEGNETLERNIKDIVWQKTAEHPAKPAGQNYIEWPEKTALYGRNGKARYWYYQNSSIDDPEILIQKTWEYLKQHSDPKISITGTVTDLKRLGYADVPVRLYDMAIVEVEPLGLLFYKQIIQLTVDLHNPQNTRPNIGDYIPNIIYINRQTDDDATGGGRGGGGGTRREKEFSEFETNILKNERNIELYARQVKENGEILRQAGMFIDPITGVLIYAEDNENNVGSKFRVQSDRITTEVQQREAGEVALSSQITQTANQIRLEVNDIAQGLSTRITQTANAITLEAQRASAAEGQLSSRITINAEGIETKVSKNGVISSINQTAEAVKIQASKIQITGETGILGALSTADIHCNELIASGGFEAYGDSRVEGNLTLTRLSIPDSSSTVQIKGQNCVWKSYTARKVGLSTQHTWLYGSSQGVVQGAIAGRIVDTYEDTTIYYLGHN